jgi:hypothetical protein
MNPTGGIGLRNWAAKQSPDRGAQPVWLREKLKDGAELEDFAVHKNSGRVRTRRRAKR